jgi:anti-anti-sigma factor
MILRAKQDGEVIVLELEGHLDFETTNQLKETCHSLMKKNNTNKVIFNLERLKFVGSSGINQFIRVLKDFNTLKEKPRFCLLSPEFQKVFKAYQTTRNPFYVYETQGEAVTSFSEPLPLETKKSPKKAVGTA